MTQSNPELIEELRAQLRTIGARKEENARRLSTMVSGSATSPDGAVTVLTAADGAIAEVRLAEHAMRYDAATLSRAITATIQAAAASARPAAPPPPPQPALAPRPVRRRAQHTPEDYDDGEVAIFDHGR
ncbi:YbaB/EbfC family nucleoid-associated protein [Amycolatopsis sp. CA-230715]|uniref:YbaB/EbfC family nucleoid-associated protein n=1 Tax=Amycolatopsis sp. CA-230715 TaxID=2745196 RepID=UPI001C02CC0A|nr:YbaB/EbfC family nucleoid-associated protein [Amycolatopsis sp. CA-230715]QWF81700.1 hypothetical protein HUW46_05133 [Amycolatopsis sp. CA-230715]